MVLTPICSAVRTLEQPCPYVSCMCAASALTGIALAHSCIKDSTCPSQKMLMTCRMRAYSVFLFVSCVSAQQKFAVNEIAGAP